MNPATDIIAACHIKIEALHVASRAVVRMLVNGERVSFTEPNNCDINSAE